MSEGILWPEQHRPEVSRLHAVNEIQVAAPPERVLSWLRRPDLFPTYYRNSRFVKRLDGPWPQVELGSRYRWFTFGVFVVSELVELDPAQGRLAWSAKELGASGHHAWLLRERDGGTHVRTEETQRGWGMALAAPVMRRLMVSQHQRWLEGLARVAAAGPPPAPGARAGSG